MIFIGEGSDKIADGLVVMFLSSILGFGVSLPLASYIINLLDVTENPKSEDR